MVVKRTVMVIVVTLAGVAAAFAQTAPAGSGQGTPPAQSAGVSGAQETRPATTTFMGDTGLWHVPTGEVLPAGKWSLSAYRVNFDDNQGFSDISNWPVTFGVGVGDRAEVFGSWVLVNRIDRDIRPLFVPSIAQAGGVVPQNPLARDGWSGNNLGDFWVGGKWALTSPWRQQPVAFALRGMLKLPTGDKTSGASTGKLDGAIDAIVSTEVNQRVELSGYGGVIFRGSPDAVEETNGVRWGIGAAFPSRQPLRFTAELSGEKYTKDPLATKTDLVATDGSILPAGFVSSVKSPVNVDLGLTWQGSNGFFAGAGWTWRVNMDKRQDFLGQYNNGANDKMGVEVRIGYHPGARIYVAPPPPPPPPTPPPAPQNGPPTVKARCEPCTVDVGKLSTVTADAIDPDGDALTYRWSAPAGSLASPTDRQTPWTAPMQEGPVQLTVTVDDGHGHTATDTVTIQVDQTGREGVRLRGRPLRLRPLLVAARSDPRARRGDPHAAGESRSAHRDRRPHLQHRHGRVQPRAR